MAFLFRKSLNKNDQDNVLRVREIEYPTHHNLVEVLFSNEGLGGIRLFVFS